VLRYAMKRLAQDPTHPMSRDAAWQESLLRCLGDDATDLQALAERKRRSLGGSEVPMGLGDFYFSPDNPLHPDYQGDDDDEELEDDDDDTPPPPPPRRKR
jgi:MoxR-like ATPase